MSGSSAEKAGSPLSGWKQHLDPAILESLVLLLTIMPSSFFVKNFTYSLIMDLTSNRLVYQALAIFLALRSMIESENQLFFILLQAHSEYIRCTGPAEDKVAILRKWQQKFSLAFRPSGHLEDHYNVWEHTIAQICDILSDQIRYLKPYKTV